jgi:hypothetical protein
VAKKFFCWRSKAVGFSLGGGCARLEGADCRRSFR